VPTSARRFTSSLPCSRTTCSTLAHSPFPWIVQVSQNARRRRWTECPPTAGYASVMQKSLPSGSRIHV
jgi:hypothetical protein